MFKDFKQSLIRWNSTTTERQKIQHSYLAITITVILVSGVISLVDAKQGHQLSRIALVAIGAFLTNAVVWNLLNSVVLVKLPQLRSKKK